MTTQRREPLPQNPPFVFPNKILERDYTAIKDDAGPIIAMGYIGPTPDGIQSQGVWVVAHDTPTTVHPATKYVYQRYISIETIL